MKKVWIAAVIACLIGAAVDVRAEEAMATEEVETEEGFSVDKALGKGGRGMANIVTCPFEVPRQMIVEANRHETLGGTLGGAIIGIPKGVVYTGWRLGVGLFDFLTAPFPIQGYDKAYIQPATLTFPNN